MKSSRTGDHGYGPVFQATLSGTCACGSAYAKGALVQRVDGTLCAVDCCGKDET